jgi:hypothetical protein
MMNNATEATTQDALLSMDDEGECIIDYESGRRSFLQAAYNLTTRVEVRSALSAALRQNA